MQNAYLITSLQGEVALHRKQYYNGRSSCNQDGQQFNEIAYGFVKRREMNWADTGTSGALRARVSPYIIDWRPLRTPLGPSIVPLFTCNMGN